MMLCHPVMAMRLVIETQKKKRSELSERGTTLRWIFLGGDFDLSPP